MCNSASIWLKLALSAGGQLLLFFLKPLPAAPLLPCNPTASVQGMNVHFWKLVPGQLVMGTTVKVVWGALSSWLLIWGIANGERLHCWVNKWRETGGKWCVLARGVPVPLLWGQCWPHNFRALLHWVIVSDADLDCIWFTAGLDTIQNKLWQP